MKPCVLTIDVEPTYREVDPAQDAEWLGLAETVDAFAELRRRLGERADRAGRPVSLTWFLRADPQIAHAHGSAAWGMSRYRPVFEALRPGGDTLGLHVHAFRWLEDQRRWLVDHADAAWVEHSIALGWEAFRDTWGVAPTCFRFGDRFLSNRVVRQLAALGVAIDLTVESGAAAIEQVKLGEGSTGSIPDYRSAPRRPYRPSRRDFRRPASFWPLPITLLPVSTGCINAKPVVPPNVEDGHAMVHLNLGLDPGWIRGIFDAVVEADPVIVSVVRSGDLADSRARDNVLANLDHIATHPAARDLDFVDPGRAVASLRAP
jgi:hypothetical protein